MSGTNGASSSLDKKALIFTLFFFHKKNNPYYSSPGFTRVVSNVYSVAVLEYDDDDIG